MIAAALHMLGGMTAGLIVFGGVWCAVTSALEWVERLRMRRADVAFAERLNDIKADAWWFSEDVPTMNLLHRIASGRFDADRLRDAWREERRALESGQAVACFQHELDESEETSA